MLQMKKLIVIIMLILSSHYIMAQHTADLGVQLGAATYWGDVQRVNTLKSVTPVVGILGRWNFNKRLALRGQLLTGNLKADGFFDKALIGQSGTRANTFAADPKSAYNFNRNFQTVEGLLEFNFRNYKMGNMKKEAFTPFVALGLGAFYSRAPRSGSFILDPNPATIVPATVGPPPTPVQYPPFTDPDGKMTNGYDVLTLTIPVALGLKFNITKRLGGMAEVVVRKTFSDNIDNLNDPSRFVNPTATQVGYTPAKTGLNNNDYYATLDFTLTWQLWNDRGNCALYDKLKR